jgi:branched-chain amino acid transport system permease protein
VTKLGGFSPIAGIDRRTPGFAGDVVNDRERFYYIALICAAVAYVLIRYLVRTPFGLSLQGVRDEPTRMASLGFNVSLHRMLAFTFAGFLAGAAGVLAAWWNGQISPSDLGLNATISLLVMAVIGGLVRIEGAWLGALAFIVINNEVTNRIPADGLWVVGGTFNTVVGLIFLAIVVVSPDGLMGLWDRGWSLGRRGGGPPQVEIEAAAGTSPS